MNYYYITGTSRGIGKALALQLLENPSNIVIGISRTESIKHPNYTHKFIDLSDSDTLVNFKFELQANAKKIYLINNAGALGLVKPVGKLDASTIIQNYAVNLIAPTVLSNAFINCYNETDAEKVIVNISSGAGKNAIDGWAVYCASKAGVDMLTKVIAEEQKIRASKPENIHNGFFVFSIAPGIVNTTMQEEIRFVDKDDFSRVNDFIDYKIQNQLSEPEVVSKKYIQLLSDVKNIKEIVTSLRDYE